MSQGPGTGDPGPGGLTRRELLGALGAAALPVLGGAGAARGDGQTARRAGGLRTEGPAGTPSDPDLLHPKIWWEKVLTAGELTTLTALADAIIPADERSPSASQVGVPDYINEWASAPYDSHREALGQIRDGLVWLDAEANGASAAGSTSWWRRSSSRSATRSATCPRRNPSCRPRRSSST